MATTINADKTIGSVIVTADTSGILSLQAAGVTLLTLDSADITVANKPVAFGGDVTISGSISADSATFTGPLVASALTLGGTAVTATAAELNILDGVTASTAELNYNDITTLGTSQASKVVTADSNGDVNLSEELKAKSYNETYVALSGTTPTVDCEAGNVFALSTSGNTTFTFSNPPTSGTAYGFALKLTAGGTHTITWPASVDWAGATAPDAPASGETDVLVFFTHDGGTTWYGAIAIDAAA